MKLFRVGVSLGASLFVLTTWLGGCSTSDNEACGIDENKDGTCQKGPSCPSGSSILNISDPVDECPSSGAGGTNYICCVPNHDSGSSPIETSSDAATPG